MSAASPSVTTGTAGLAAACARSEASTHAEAKPEAPRAVTRGETYRDQVTKVDWLNATFPGPEKYSPAEFLRLLGRVFKRPITGIESRGLFGFEHGIKLIAHVGSRSFPIGNLAFGGEAQRGRWMLQLTGAGCGVVPSWWRLAQLLRALDARLTRLDLAVDFLGGEYSVDDAVTMYRNGEFKMGDGGRQPSTTQAGDWIGDGREGRTLYVGKAANGKLLRVYEKGKQLGDFESRWTRFEVQLGNKDRVIPIEAMLQCDQFIAGCYPALQRMLGCAALRIDTMQTSGAVTLAHLMFHLKRSYGKLIGLVGDTLTPEAFELIEQLRVTGAPRRLHPSAVASGLTWAQLIARLRK